MSKKLSPEARIVHRRVAKSHGPEKGDRSDRWWQVLNTEFPTNLHTYEFTYILRGKITMIF
jgi:hypothetical protein